VKGRKRNLPRNKVGGRAPSAVRILLRPHQFGVPGKLFRRRYRMSRDLFLFILQGIRDYDRYFQCRHDATGALGFTLYKKCSATIRILSYGMAVDIFDEYMRMGDSTCLNSMYRFLPSRAFLVQRIYYLREATVKDTTRMLSINATTNSQT
jgi:hypothetical protein